MNKAQFIGAIVAIAALAGQPCAAATIEHTSAFAGMTVRLPLGQARPAKAVARLQLSTAFHVRDSGSGLIRSRKAPGLELGALGSGKPTLYLNGTSTAAFRTKLEMSGTTTALVIGGIVLIVAVAAAAAAAGGAIGDTCPEYEGSRAHCINP